MGGVGPWMMRHFMPRKIQGKSTSAFPMFIDLLTLPRSAISAPLLLGETLIMVEVSILEDDSRLLKGVERRLDVDIVSKFEPSLNANHDDNWHSATR